jgi:hypothetical protein
MTALASEASMKFWTFGAVLGINPESRCFGAGTAVDINRRDTMPNKTMLATLALGTVIAFAAPAFADKMKATLDGKSQVPPNTSAAPAPPTSTTIPPARS